MGFFNNVFEVIKNVGTAAVTQLEKSTNEIREIKLKYEKMDDNELLRIVHSEGVFGESKQEKGIAFGILRNRGLEIEYINSKKS